MSPIRVLVVSLAAVAASLPVATAGASSAKAKATCTGGKTVRATATVRVSRTRGGVVTACHKPTGHREDLGTDAPNNRIDGIAIHGRRVRFVLHSIHQDSQYDVVQVIDARTGAIVSVDFLAYGTA